jgi:hypothetical protein
MLYVFQGTGIGSGMFSSIPQIIKRSIGGLLSPILARLVHFALAHPTLKAWALTWVCRYPALESRLYRFASIRGLITSGATLQIYSDLSRLTPSALLIYADLKASIERYNKGNGN